MDEGGGSPAAHTVAALGLVRCSFALQSVT